MVPAPYSELTARAPRTPIVISRSMRPRRLMKVGSNDCRSSSSKSAYRRAIAFASSIAIPAPVTSEPATISGPGRVLRNLMNSDRTILRKRVLGCSGAAVPSTGGVLIGILENGAPRSPRGYRSVGLSHVHSLA